MLHDPKTVIVSDFDQETAEKIAPQFIARLELANCTWYLFFCSQPVITSQSSIFCWTCNIDKSEVHAQAWNVPIVADIENFRQDTGMRKKVFAPGYDQDCSVDQDHPHSSVSSETDDYFWLKIGDPVCILPPSCHPPLWTGRLLVDSWSPWLSL